jgi:hypothetical protein
MSDNILYAQAQGNEEFILNLYGQLLIPLVKKHTYVSRYQVRQRTHLMVLYRSTKTQNFLLIFIIIPQNNRIP